MRSRPAADRALGARRASAVAAPPTLRERASGILLHVTSLPGPHGNGDLGAPAHAFAQALAAAGQRWWQTLPIGPSGYGDSPYASFSAFAGEPLLIDLDALGLDVEAPRLAEGPIDYAAARRLREGHLRRAFEARARRPLAERRSFGRFCERHADWLDDFALFAALKGAHEGRAWTAWERALRRRAPAALARASRRLAPEIELAKFAQFHFDRQWSALRARCHALGVGLIGDLPLFVAHDSVDVWRRPELFELDEAGAPRAVAGVPPDYFSATGQRWGNPLYRWARHRAEGYAWWVARFAATLRRFDAIRLDHFIGYVRNWRIPAAAPLAVEGAWRAGPGRALFDRLREALGGLPLIAEDLGAITPAVTRLRRELGLPGMAVVQFAFGADVQAARFLPHAHLRRQVVYTGTHDNDTALGWFADRGGGPDATRTAAEAAAERRALLRYLGREAESDASARGRAAEIPWAMVRLALSSVARTVIVPMQDVLGLGSDARMNRPGQATGNWRWRLPPGAFDAACQARLREACEAYGRASP